MLVRQNLKPEALPGLLTWLQLHKSEINCLQGHCGSPHMGAALSSLLATQQLKSVHLCLPTAAEVQILSLFTSVTVRTLRRPHALKHLDLSCLNIFTKLGGLTPLPGHLLQCTPDNSGSTDSFGA